MDEGQRKVQDVLVDQLGGDLQFLRASSGNLSPGLADFCFEASLGGASHLLCVDLKSAPLRGIEGLSRKAREISRHQPQAIYLFAAPHLSERAKRLLESHGVNYLDFAGDVRIREPGLYVKIDVKGEKRVRPRLRSGSNPFSKKASLVARVLLHEVERFWGIREMSQEAGLSVGYASEVMRELNSRGYTEKKRGQHRLIDPVLLLQDWAESYSWEDNEIYSFVVPAEKEEVMRALAERLSVQAKEYAFTLLTATDLVAPHVSHDQTQVYVVESLVPDVTSFLQAELSAEPVPSGGNCHILVPYYGKATFYAKRRIAGAPVVSNEQLFLDLFRYPVRGIEAAGVLARTELAEQLNLSREQVKALQDWLAA